MNTCAHNSIKWETMESIGLEGTILKAESVKIHFGDDVSVKASDCPDCNKAIIEITKG